MMLLLHPLLLLHLLLLSVLAQDAKSGGCGSEGPGVEEEVDPVCQRFCPDDVKAAIFRPMVAARVDWVEATMEEAIQGLEKLREKTAAIPSSLKAQMGVEEGEEQDREGAELRTLVAQLLVHGVRGEQRAWGRMQDTHMDILHPSRAPKAPRSLSDLRVEVEGLAAAWRETEDSFEGLKKSLGSSLAKLLGPMLTVMEGMVKAAGEGGAASEVALDKLKTQVDNLMGRVLLRMVVRRMEGTEVGDTPRMFGCVTDLATTLARDFARKGRRLTLEEFWKDELVTLKVPKNEDDEDDEEVEEDVLETEEVILIAALVEANLPPPLDFSKFNLGV